MKKSAADIIREYGPFPGVEQVAGVTYDGRNVWFAPGGKINALDPADGKIQRSIDIAAHAGTAFDGQHLYQIGDSVINKIDPQTGKTDPTHETTSDDSVARGKDAEDRPPTNGNHE